MPLPLRSYTYSRRDAVQLDFRAADQDGAPARLQRRATIGGDRTLLFVNAKKNIGGQSSWRR
jgi:hypothetical protein